MKTLESDRGSLAPLGIFGVLLLMLLTGVVVGARESFLLQRQLSAVSDSLALDLADLSLLANGSIEIDLAREELRQLAPEQFTQIVISSLDSKPGSAKVTLCRKASATRWVSWMPTDGSSQICTTSHASTDF